MTARRSVLIQLLALALAIGMAFFAWPLFGGTGRGAEEALRAGTFFPSFMSLVVLGTTFAVVRGRRAPAAGIFGALALASAFYTFEQGALLGVAVARGAFTLRVLLALLFGLFVGLAPVMARVQQNPWMGVRTPWTLGSRRVWRETHRATGRLWLVGGVVGSALTMFGAPLLPVLGFLVFLLLYPVAISYFVWRRLGRP